MASAWTVRLQFLEWLCLEVKNECLAHLEVAAADMKENTRPAYNGKPHTGQTPRVRELVQRIRLR
jgi:hypothetical protein